MSCSAGFIASNFAATRTRQVDIQMCSSEHVNLSPLASMEQFHPFCAYHDANGTIWLPCDLRTYAAGGVLWESTDHLGWDTPLLPMLIFTIFSILDVLVSRGYTHLRQKSNSTNSLVEDATTTYVDFLHFHS